MPFTAADVMKRASTILQDTNAVRWTAMELCDWLNEAQRIIVAAKPNALSKTVTLTLGQGTRQELPAAYTILSKVVCNAAVDGTARNAVRTLARRELLDTQMPGWHDTTKLPFNAQVSMVWQDFMAPREFYVVPGNTGTGRVQAIVGTNPVPVPLPDGNPLDTDSYVTLLGFPDLYQSILLDLVLARAFAKDSASPDAMQRSGNHLQLATNALAALSGSEGNSGLAYAFAPPDAG